MDKVGRLVAKNNGFGQIEWRRVVSVNPVQYSGPLAITKVGASAPERYPAIDKSVVCQKCDGSGRYPEDSAHVCSECGGNGRKKLMPMQKPRPHRPFLGWLELSPLGRR